MSTSLEDAVHFTLVAEGGFVCDDGGDTMYGVTQSVYDMYRGRQKKPLQSVRGIVMQEVLEIMRDLFWLPAHCDDLPRALAIAHFDWAYNHSPQGAIKTLQQVLGVAIDGAYGQKTSAAVVAQAGTVLGKYLDARRTWYHNAVAGNATKYSTYLQGWLNRVDNLEKYLAVP